MDIGERIKRRRKQLGMSAETLAERIGKSPATVYRYEKGDINKVDSRNIPEIAKALCVEPGYLMGWDDGSQDEPADPAETELVAIYRSLNAPGREMLLRTARSYAKDDEYKKGGRSSKEMA